MNLSDPQLLQALQSLLPRSRRILELRAAGWTFERIGEKFGLSRTHVYRLHSAALRRLKAKLKR